MQLVEFSGGQGANRRNVPSLSKHRPLEKGTSLVYRICGGAAFENAAARELDADTFVVSEPDFFEFVQQNQRVMPEFVSPGT